MIGLAWLVLGLADLFITLGRHVGWPMLVLAGALPLIHLTL